MIKIFRASYDSRSFSFEAYGQTKEDAKNSLAKGMAKHAKQYKINKNWFDIEDIDVNEFELKTAYRDRTKI